MSRRTRKTGIRVKQEEEIVLPPINGLAMVKQEIPEDEEFIESNYLSHYQLRTRALIVSDLADYTYEEEEKPQTHQKMSNKATTSRYMTRSPGEITEETSAHLISLAKMERNETVAEMIRKRKHWSEELPSWSSPSSSSGSSSSSSSTSSHGSFSVYSLPEDFHERKIPKLELQTKQDEVENAEVAKKMSQGEWHLPICPSDEVINRFIDFDFNTFPGAVICGEYCVRDLIAIGEDSIIYCGSDTQGNGLSVKVSFSKENDDLIRELRQSQNPSGYVQIPILSEQFEMFYLSVAELENIDLERVRKIYNFALIDRQINAILTQCAAGLAEIHRLGFIHGDICAANILLRGATLYEEGEHQLLRRIHCRITDFNSAITMGDASRPTKLGIVQQAMYRAPEVILELPADSKIDMWSLGIVGLDLVCPGHWGLDDYDVTDALRAGEHLYRMDRSIYSICWKLFERAVQIGNKDVYWAYQDFYKKRLRLNFPAYVSADKILQDFIKQMLKTNPDQRLSSQEACCKYPVDLSTS